MGQVRQEKGSNDQAGWVPWRTKERMKLLALCGLPLAVLVLALGVFMAATSRGGVPLIIVGGLLMGVWAVALPIAQRRRKI